MTRFRPWRNSDLTVPIRWYRCSPGALDFPGETCFGSRLYESDPEEIVGPGEQFGSPRKRVRGTAIPGATGQHFCGTLEEFRDGCLYSPDLTLRPLNQDGLCLDCLHIVGAAAWESGLGLSAEFVSETIRVSSALADLGLDGSFSEGYRPVIDALADLALGGEFLAAFRPKVIPLADLALDGSFVGALRPRTDALADLALDGAFSEGFRPQVDAEADLGLDGEFDEGFRPQTDAEADLGLDGEFEADSQGVSTPCCADGVTVPRRLYARFSGTGSPAWDATVITLDYSGVFLYWAHQPYITFGVYTANGFTGVMSLLCLGGLGSWQLVTANSLGGGASVMGSSNICSGMPDTYPGSTTAEPGVTGTVTISDS